MRERGENQARRAERGFLGSAAWLWVALTFVPLAAYLPQRSTAVAAGSDSAAANRAAEPTLGAQQIEEHEGHRDPASYIEMLERPDRAGYQKPEEVVAALELRAGDVVADIGAGSGYFTMRLARAVGPGGRVYAEDVWGAMVDHLKARKTREELENVEVVLGSPADPKLPHRALDMAFICNAWHHIEDRPRFLQNLELALKPEGRIVIIDYKASKTPVGPPLKMRVPRAQVVSDLAAAGFSLVSEPDILPYQYFLIFRAAGRARQK